MKKGWEYYVTSDLDRERDRRRDRLHLTGFTDGWAKKKEDRWGNCRGGKYDPPHTAQLTYQQGANHYNIEFLSEDLFLNDDARADNKPFYTDWGSVWKPGDYYNLGEFCKHNKKVWRCLRAYVHCQQHELEVPRVLT